MSCLFCRIAAGEIPADTVFENDRVLAFRDINPAAPTHILVIPKKHISTMNDASEDDQMLLGEMMLVARDIAAMVQSMVTRARTGRALMEEAGASTAGIIFLLITAYSSCWRFVSCILLVKHRFIIGVFSVRYRPSD